MTLNKNLSTLYLFVHTVKSVKIILDAYWCITAVCLRAPRPAPTTYSLSSMPYSRWWTWVVELIYICIRSVRSVFLPSIIYLSSTGYIRRSGWHSTIVKDVVLDGERWVCTDQRQSLYNFLHPTWVLQSNSRATPLVQHFQQHIYNVLETRFYCLNCYACDRHTDTQWTSQLLLNWCPSMLWQLWNRRQCCSRTYSRWVRICRSRCD